MRDVRKCCAFARVMCGLAVLVGVSRAQVWAQGDAATPPAQGTISGRVLDRSTGDPIIEAGVEVTQTGKRVRTDLDGKYKLTVPAGTYELRVFAPLYTGTRLQNVIVRSAAVTTADANLLPEGKSSVEVVEVVAQADKAAEATQLLERKNSAVVSDNVSAETIRKSPDSNAAEVVKRVPAVTIQGNKYVYVRGLGERYSSALLNGSRLPSTDPNRRVVPLDLFPADFIEALNIIKSYTPNLPGDFSGGLVDIRLKDYPENLSYSLGVNTGGNTNATFRTFDTYHASPWADYFGSGASYRALPSIIPNTLLGTPPLAQGRVYASKFHNVWNVHDMVAPPNTDVNFSIGNSWGPVGAALGGIYTTEYKVNPGEFSQEFTNGGNGPNGSPIILPFGDLTYDRDTFETRLGGVWTSAWQPTPTDKIAFRALVNRSSFDEVIDGVGRNRNNLDQQISQRRFQYTVDQLGFGQIAGDHSWDNAQLSWRTALSQTTEDQPDTRYVSYVLNPIPGVSRELVSANDPIAESLERLYANLDEHLSDSAVDLTVPFRTALPFTDTWSGLPAKFKFGPSYAYRHRNFDFRRFLYDRITYQGIDPALSPQQLLVPQNIGVNFRFREGSQPKDSFEASEDIAAFYGMFDLPILPGTRTEEGQLVNQLRLVAGVRTEYSYISTFSYNDLGEPVHPTVNDLNPLPGINLIYSPREDTNFRLGYSETVSRPEFRELTPTEFPVPNGQRPVIGNPYLISATIQSVDLRWEQFLSPLELLSASFFYKELTNPIEQIVIGESAGEADSFKNAENGTLYGFEVEGRKNFGFLASRAHQLGLGSGEWLANLSLASNVAYIESNVNIGRGVGAQVQTSTSRSLQGQAPYIVNSALEYQMPSWSGVARLLYNTAGERLVAAGTDRLPDIFEEPRNQLDFVLLGKINPFGTPLTAKFAAENILNDAYVQLQGGQLVEKFRTGVKFVFGISYTY